MAVAFVGGAALGAVFGELLRAVEDVVSKSASFNSILKQLQSTLNRVTPTIEDIEKLNRVLDRPQLETDMFTDRLREGQRLVLKCAKVRCWNYCAKYSYAKKLMALEKSLLNFFIIDVAAVNYRDTKDVLVAVNRVDSKLDRMGTMGGFVGCCGIPGVRDFVVGFYEPLRVLKMQILDGKEQVVVISAAGGCGKTTLAKMLCHDAEIKVKFGDNIFFVIASKTPSIMVIIEKLFQHKGYPVPAFQTDEDAMNQLVHMLKKFGPNPILLVLDDVWSGLESFIEFLKQQISDMKILVTSRFEFPRFNSTIKLKPLKDQDAKALFCHSAFPHHGSSSIPDDLVNKIVKGCGGFPLALDVVGRSLCGRRKEIWKHVLKQWSEGQSIFDSESNKELLTCLQTSLNTLVERYKECYLDLASFPEDQRIPATALMDMWVELYNLGENGEDTIAILDELSKRSLVEQVIVRKDASDASGYYNEHFVMQHDLLRELAIHQSSQEPIEQRTRFIMDIRGTDLPRWWIEQGQHPIHARLVSLSTDEMFSSNWHDMQLPKVEVLVLNIQTRDYTLPQFMEKMDQLKVLIITNYGFCSAEIKNFPLPRYLSSLKRIRLEHVSISSISNSILQMRNLRKLSLIMCEIAEAFRNCTVHIPDMLPNLVEIVIDYCNDLVEFPAWLCNIRFLKELSITNCHELVAIPEGFGKLQNLEVLRLHACTKLLELPKSIRSLHKLDFLDISDCISLTELPEQMGELFSLRNLHMRGCQGLSELPCSVKNLEQLKEVICDEETAYLWEQYKIDLINLEINVLKEDVNLDWLHDLQP
ncbi:Disease resistance protein [Actinidia chinensis var. chinensis]|uniref:Disease resistance protein n=1 Tax=Actinidia chinensis var. chinensis TaxID=1590841 RepID=A0A2R6R6B8_ACTCC|nr:Disease resistance protein [Actinidia chinensis var. chinensis]